MFNLRKISLLSLLLVFVIIFSSIPIKINAATIQSVDQMLLISQKWLNENFRGINGYQEVPEDGTSRSATIDGLIMAFQTELGITSTAPNFGTGTISKFNSIYPNGIIQQSENAPEESKVYGIIQCALWVNGYATEYGGITKHFYNNTGNAIITLKSNMGFINPNSKITLNVMKSILSMNQFKKISGGTDQIRSIQQELNRNYEAYLGIIPCDGVYGRQMNTALIKVLQAIEGYSPSQATGNFGAGTKANLPITLEPKSIKLLQYALTVNGYGDLINLENTELTSQLSSAIYRFQQDMVLNPPTGQINVDTWMSLLLSTGNPDRVSTACDTRFEMTDLRLQYLRKNEYSIVGRYLTGGDFKQIRDGELMRILSKDIAFFPIFQESGTDLTYFSSTRGIQDAISAENAALSYGIPENSIIYFAVDTDPTDPQITNYVIPYFRSLSENMTKYRIGIYGTRNTCTQIVNLGYAITSFISDLSTGFSGNMGFKLPTNWNFDQFSEIKVTSSGDIWDLDKVAYSGKFEPVTRLTKTKYGSRDLTGSDNGDEFGIPKGAKKIRFTVSYDFPEDKHMGLQVNLAQRAIVPNQTDEFVYVNGTYMDLGNPFTNERTSEWIDISDLMGYRFEYRCIDYDKPIYWPNPDEPIEPQYEDGSCSLDVYMEFQY